MNVVRLVNVIKMATPGPLRPIARPIYRSVRDLHSASNLLLRTRELRSRYSKSFLVEVHPKDEMCMYDYGRVCADSQLKYFRTGERNFQEFLLVLKDMGYVPDQQMRFLDFACGYGRLTRFFVTVFPRQQVTVSDIDRDAVDFVRSRLGVDGFYSVADPDELGHHCSYDIIFVASLFSHLNQSNWEAWLRKLYSMLSHRGLLIFSTHGLTLYDALNQEMKTQVHLVAPGFHYWETNETSSRLDARTYGTTYVSEQYVIGSLARNGLPNLHKYYPKALWGTQDVYVIKRDTH